MSRKVITGLEKGYYAIMKDQASETYDTVKELGDLIEISVAPSEGASSLYAGNKEALVETALSGIEMTFTVPALETEVMCDLFGCKLAAEGGIIQSSKDIKPYVAIMVEKTLDDGAKEYLTLYKGKLNLAEDKAKTQEGAVEFQSRQFSGKFIPLNDGVWNHIVRSTDTDFDPEAWGGKWGKTVTKATAKVTPTSEAKSKSVETEEVEEKVIEKK